MHSVTRTIFPLFAFKITHRVILLTRFCKLLTRVATLSGGHVPQVPQWHDASDTANRCSQTIIVGMYKKAVIRFSLFHNQCHKQRLSISTVSTIISKSLLVKTDVKCYHLWRPLRRLWEPERDRLLERDLDLYNKTNKAQQLLCNT